MEKMSLEMLEKESLNYLQCGVFKNVQSIEDEYYAIKEKLQNHEIADYSDNFLFYSCFRMCIIDLQGYSLITPKFIDNLSEYLKGKKCLEIMGGLGTLSKALSDKKINITCTDDMSWDFNNRWTNIEKLKAEDAIKKYNDVDYIIMSWAPYDTADGYNALMAMRKYNPKCKMIVIGEQWGGCTCNDEFFEAAGNYKILDLGLKEWYGINDVVYEVQ